MENDQWMII